MIAPTADVNDRARVAESARIWDLAQVREDASVGENCIVGRGAYIDVGVVVGDNCKIQNGASIYAPTRLADGVFVGPGVIFTNDTHPRAVTPDKRLKTADDWTSSGVTVDEGASVGAGAIVLGGVHVGAWSLIAAGSVVTRDVPAHGLVVGAPARRVGWVGRSGEKLVSRDGLLWDESTTATYVERDGKLAER